MRNIFTVIDANYKKGPKVPDRDYIFYYIIWFLWEEQIFSPFLRSDKDALRVMVNPG